MSTLLHVLFMTIGVCYATNCYELQQSQITSLNDRMAQMLNSFYTPLIPNTPAPIPTAADYGSPYDNNPYQYVSANIPYGPPASYKPAIPKLAIKPPYYNTDVREYAYNWGNYNENYAPYSEFERSPYNPLMSYSTTPQSYTPLGQYFPPPTPFSPPPIPLSPPPYVSPCLSSPPLPSYPAWEYPFIPEYPIYNYPTCGQPTAQFTQYAAQPPASYPLPLLHRYAEIAPSPPYFY